MLDYIKHITVDGKEYPVAFNINISEAIQNEYGSISKWASLIKPEDVNKEDGSIEEKEPDIKDIIWTFKEMINEGIDIENEDKSEKRSMLTHKQVGRIMTVFGIKESTEVITEVVINSSPKSDPENPTKAQS